MGYPGRQSRETDKESHCQKEKDCFYLKKMEICSMDFQMYTVYSLLQNVIASTQNNKNQQYIGKQPSSIRTFRKTFESIKELVFISTSIYMVINQKYIINSCGNPGVY